MLMISKCFQYASGLCKIVPVLSNGWASPEEADGLQDNMPLSIHVKNRLHNEMFPGHDIHYINDKPRKHIM